MHRSPASSPLRSVECVDPCGIVLESHRWNAPFGVDNVRSRRPSITERLPTAPRERSPITDTGMLLALQRIAMCTLATSTNQWYARQLVPAERFTTTSATNDAMKRMRWSVVRTLLASVLFGSIALSVVAAVLLSSNLKSKEQVYSVKVGMTQADVLKELGEPRFRSSGNVWHYEVWGANDLYCICFDESNKVCAVSY
jgi:hypothetical protein